MLYYILFIRFLKQVKLSHVTILSPKDLTIK